MLFHKAGLVAANGAALPDEIRAAAFAFARAVAGLHGGRVDGDAQQEAQRIDQDVALAAGDLLARVKTLRVECRAPF